MQNSVICTSMTSLYGFQHSSAFFSFKTATLRPDLQVCMGPILRLWFWAHITACLAQEYKVYIGCSPHLWFCACKTAWLAPEELVSMGSSSFCMQKSDFWGRITTLYGSQTTPVVFCMQYSVISTRITCLYLSQCFLHAKQLLFDQNYKSLWVPALTCCFVHEKSDFWGRITTLYWSQPSSVVFACKTETSGAE